VSESGEGDGVLDLDISHDITNQLTTSAAFT